ncbi:FIST signal transduction protein [Pseudonocardia endophytica]|uniref:Small ligand-binding sensory domain FIST n=1 Tax=Pseudonocardia endophytica TaxID=401976 RepID=A0A4R1I0W3_PSEEN|nr:FIST N-terminal domain-containing protein [Pseudonocardia endophytica]TCK26069.1 small ligand-binding sensory domain FIST [Pseudonocardia endophytica]
MTDTGRSRFGQGLGVGDDLPAAADEAVDLALAGLDGAVPDLVVLFVSPGRGNRTDLAEQAGRRVMERAGARACVGATAHGVIGDARGVEHEPAVAVWAATLPGVTITPLTLTAEMTADRGMTFDGLPEPAADDRVALLLADPYSFPVGGLLDDVNDRFPDLRVMGGLASAAGLPGANRLFLDGEAHRDGAVGLLLGGPVSARTVVSQGCRPIGPAMIVTRSEQNRLVELAGQPAGEQLRKIVMALDTGERENALRGLQVGTALDEYAEEHERGDFLIRPVMGMDQDTGAVVVGEPVEVGRTVRFQVRDVAGAEQDLVELLGQALDGRPARGALLFSCNGRGASMFGTSDHDVRVVRERLGDGGDDVPVVGLFAAGEVGPVAGRNHLHGFTASVLLFD